MVYKKNFFCSEFADILDKAGKKRKEGQEHTQMQSVMSFPQNQWYIVVCYLTTQEL